MAASTAIIAVIVRRRRRRREQSQRKKRLWIRPWVLKREKLDVHHCLFEELKLSDRNGLKNFLRMDESSFNEILDKVAPLYRNKIPNSEHLSTFFATAILEFYLCAVGKNGVIVMQISSRT